MEKNLDPLFQSLFDKTREISGIGVWHVDLKAQSVFWDESTKKIHEVPLDFEPDLAGGINFYKEGFYRDEITRLCNNIIEKGESFEVELIIITAKDREIWVKSIGMPEYDNGEVVGFYGTFQDITKEKQDFDEITVFKERFQLAAAAANVGVWDWDVMKNSLLWDEQMYHLYGIKEEDFTGAYDAWQSGLHPDDKVPGDELIQLTLFGKAEFDTQFRVVWPSGEIRYIQAKAVVFRDDKGNPLRMLGTNWDITEETLRKQSLENLTEKLKNSNEQLEEFAYVASHDLKTPIRNMAHYATFLEDDYGEHLDEDGIKMINGIKDQARRMTGLVDDLLSYSKVNKMKLEATPAPINSLLNEVVELLDLDNQNNIKLDIQELGELKVDIIKTREVFNNLIANAIKYNDSEVKEIKIWREQNKIYIKDNGIGIDESMKDKVFAFFKRLHAKDEYGGGTGAGMAIVQKVLDRHGASIDFESKVGEGTVFFIDYTSCVVD